VQLLDPAQFTRDRRHLARIPDAIAWLEASRLPDRQTEDGTRTHPTLVEVGTSRGRYAHRKGTGVADGVYWVDYDDKNLLAHYGGKANVNIQRLKDEYEKVSKLTPEEATANSPLKATRFERGETPQQYFLTKRIRELEADPSLTAADVMDKLDNRGRWLTQNEWISRPYAISADGKEVNTARLSDENGNSIRDSSDQQYISVREYIKNMNVLMKTVLEAQ